MKTADEVTDYRGESDVIVGFFSILGDDIFCTFERKKKLNATRPRCARRISLMFQKLIIFLVLNT